MTPEPHHSGVRRVICGHDADGRSAIVADGEAPSVQRPGGSVIIELWRLAETPPDVNDPDTLEGNIGAAPPSRGAIARMVTFPPESEMDLEAFDRAMVETYGPQPRDAPGAEPTPRGMHRTETVDVVTVLSGEIYAVLDTEETLLRAGDSIVHRGTNHAWSNRSNKPTTMVSVMVGATR